MPVPWLSVVIPVYNEEAVVAGTVAAAEAWLAERGRPGEILVVDNASTDGTAAVLAALAEGGRVRVLRNEENLGKGFSVCRGMLAAAGELRLLLDADCATSLASLDALVAAAERGADVVAGSRVAPGAEVEQGQPLRRRLVGWPFIALTRLVLREPTRDVYCGFKLWRAEAAEAVFARQTLSGWAFDAESLGLARRLGFGIAEVGVRWTDRRGSKLSILHTLVPATRELLAARRSVSAAARTAAPDGNPAGAPDGDPAAAPVSR